MKKTFLNFLLYLSTIIGGVQGDQLPNSDS